MLQNHKKKFGSIYTCHHIYKAWFSIDIENAAYWTIQVYQILGANGKWVIDFDRRISFSSKIFQNGVSVWRSGFGLNLSVIRFLYLHSDYNRPIVLHQFWLLDLKSCKPACFQKKRNQPTCRNTSNHAHVKPVAREYGSTSFNECRTVAQHEFHCIVLFPQSVHVGSFITSIWQKCLFSFVKISSSTVCSLF